MRSKREKGYKDEKMKQIFIIGSKGIPARYGGFETFVDQLVRNRKAEEIQYHVACLDNKEWETEYCKARCFHVKVPDIGPAKAVYYDLKALSACLDYIEREKIEGAVVYILACRIGPFIKHYKKRFRKLGAKLYVNPDGQEWKRGKWNRLIRSYWKASWELMVKHADLVICDAKSIEAYIRQEYRNLNVKTLFIPYGAEKAPVITEAETEKWTVWSQKHQVERGEYYLIVGRFVPENNYYTMLKEFHCSRTQKKLVIITNPDNQKLWDRIRSIPGVVQDERICFVGTVYEQALLWQIRKRAFAYLHGHEVGGTNPSLLEALAATKCNLLLDVSFNREVAEDGAFYWTKEPGNLARLLEKVERMEQTEIDRRSLQAGARMKEAYDGAEIVRKYESLFMK